SRDWSSDVCSSDLALRLSRWRLRLLGPSGSGWTRALMRDPASAGQREPADRQMLRKAGGGARRTSQRTRRSAERARWSEPGMSWTWVETAAPRASVSTWEMATNGGRARIGQVGLRPLPVAAAASE